MKQIIAIAAILSFAASVASAQVKNFKYDGLLEIHKYYATNTHDYDSNADDKDNDQDYRANLGFSFDAGQDANVQINLIKPSAVKTVEFGQAYVGFNNLLGLSHKFGRMFYGTPGDMVIYYGPDAWYVSDMGYTALEGWTGDWKNDKLTITALIAKESDTKNSKTDTDIYGVTANYSVNEYFNPAAYVYQWASSDTGLIFGTVGMDRLNVMGVKANGKFMGLEYTGEYAMNSGDYINSVTLTKFDYKGHAVRINAAYGFDLIGKAKISGEYLTASGDKGSSTKNENFYGIMENYRPGIIIGSANNPVANRTTWNLGANWTPEKLNKLNLEAKFYNFATTEKVTVGANSYDAYGTELDIAAVWNHTENMALKGYYAITTADNKYSKAMSIGNDNAIQIGLLASVKF